MKTLRVLVIDDEKVIGDACRMVLTEKGHRVSHCLTGSEGLRAIDREAYDLILLDMKLPDIDGSKILNRVKKQVFRPTIIVMTGYSTLTNAIEAMKLGAVDYLAKPFTEDDLLAAIEEQFKGL
jgi:DNA-binding NtrC family response regulator